MALKENTKYDYNKTLAPAVQPITAAIDKMLGSTKPQAASSAVGNTFGAPIGQGTQTPKAKVGEGQRYGNLGVVTVAPGGSTRYEKTHPGIDIANKIGTQIPTFTGGKVTAVKTGAKQGSPGYGNYVIVTDEEGNKHRYSHLQNSFVQVGQTVPKGAPLGTMGNTGQTYSTSGGTGSHLDYRIMDMYNKYMNPWNFLT